jgi:hypothetical protein
MILVDGIQEHDTTLRWKQWSHMVSTTGRDELDAFAAQIGLKLDWFQSDSFAHYDIVPSKRRLAVAHGALQVNSRLLLFGNYDYANKRPGKPIPEPYRTQLAQLHEVCAQGIPLGLPEMAPSSPRSALTVPRAIVVSAAQPARRRKP